MDFQLDMSWPVLVPLPKLPFWLLFLDFGVVIETISLHLLLMVWFLCRTCWVGSVFFQKPSSKPSPILPSLNEWYHPLNGLTNHRWFDYTFRYPGWWSTTFAYRLVALPPPHFCFPYGSQWWQRIVEFPKGSQNIMEAIANIQCLCVLPMFCEYYIRLY
jgi:hypothetical protein